VSPSRDVGARRCRRDASSVGPPPLTFRDRSADNERQGRGMDWTRAPKRVEGIEVNEVADGYIVYQAAQDRVHYLNRTAVLVLEMCNGRLAAGEIPELLKEAYDLAEPPTEEVATCLTKLLEEGLVR